MELYRKVRLARRGGMSERAAAVHFGVSRAGAKKMGVKKMGVKKIIGFSVSPGYRRTAQIKRPKLDGFTGFIEQWLLEDLSRNRKQRHAATRVFQRLRDVEPWSRPWSAAHGEGLQGRLHDGQELRP